MQGLGWIEDRERSVCTGTYKVPWIRQRLGPLVGGVNRVTGEHELDRLIGNHGLEIMRWYYIWMECCGSFGGVGAFNGDSHKGSLIEDMGEAVCGHGRLRKSLEGVLRGWLALIGWNPRNSGIL